MVAGAEHVGEGEQGRDQRRVGARRELDQGAVGQRNPDGLGLAAFAGELSQKPPCSHEVCRPSRQNWQVPSEKANGATTRSPFLRVADVGTGLLDDADELVTHGAGPSSGDIER